MEHNAAVAVIEGGPKYPDAGRDLCFDLWDTVCQHNYVKLAMETGHNVNTLRSWGLRDGWQRRSLERRLDVQPEEVRHLTGALLQVAARDCAIYYANVASGAIEPHRAKSETCRAICHMAGWSPTHYLPMREKAPAPKRDLPDLDTMTDDELLALERELSGAE